MKLSATPIVTSFLGASILGILMGCTPQDKPESAAPHADHATPAPMTHSDGMTMTHNMGTKGLNALKSLKGKEFDIAFLSQMIAHHEAAVMMAKQALSTAKKPETKQNAQKVIDAQTVEIAQMTAWLKEWYQATPNAAQQALVKEDMKDMMSMPVTSDMRFFEMMIPHHQGAIDMSELAKAQSERPEVKKLAGEIITAQKAEITEYHKLMGHGG